MTAEKYPEIEIEKLKPYENNARLHSEKQIEQIVNSIKEFGFITPVIIDENDMILVGHGRTMAAKKAGLLKVPYRRVTGLSYDKKRAYILADNRLSDIAGWDEELLKVELENIELDMSNFGFDDFNLELEESSKTQTQQDEVPEKPKKAKSKAGDMYRLGRHTLYCADSLQPENVKNLLSGHYCELTFTDPPYELIYKGGGILKNSKSMQEVEKNGVYTFDPLQLQLYSDTNIYFHNKPLIKKYIELAEVKNEAYDLAFYKKLQTAPNYKGHLMTDCEYIAIVGGQDPNKGLEKEMYSKCFIGQKDEDNELSYSKPLALCEKYIKLYSKGYVLDLFGGSGSTLIACEQLGHTCFMLEKEPEFIDVIIERWEKLTGKKAELIQVEPKG